MHKTLLLLFVKSSIGMNIKNWFCNCTHNQSGRLTKINYLRNLLTPRSILYYSAECNIIYFDEGVDIMNLLGTVQFFL
jgi:hypothetical protein